MSPAFAAEELPAERAPRSAALLEQLSNDSTFHKLLHYRRNLLGHVASEVDDDRFFLAPTGANDPLAELVALVDRLEHAIPTAPDQDVRCRFPARVAWLLSRVELPHREASCPQRDAFLRELDVKSVSLVSAASSFAHPASAIGHAFLLLRPQSDDGATVSKRSTSIDFRATADTSVPLLYAAKGLGGLFVGRFERRTGADKFEGFARFEDRDLWEFELALTSEEVERFTLHLWEMRLTEIDYFYLTENCAYHALGLLEVASPHLDLLDRLEVIVPPIDAVRVVTDEPGLVRKARYFPSDSTRNRDGSSPRFLEPDVFRAPRDPRLSHGSMRFGLGTGYASLGGPFFSLHARLSLHDLLDPSVGRSELQQLQLLAISTRYSPETNVFTFDRVTFFEMFVLHPLGSPSWLSWRIRASGDRPRDDGCPSGDCFVHGLDIGAGVAVGDDRRAVVLYALGTASSLFSEVLRGVDGSFVRLGVGPEAGLRLRLGDVTTALVSARFHYLPWQAQETTYDVQAGVRARLARDVALGAEGRVQPNSSELQLASYFYF